MAPRGRKAKAQGEKPALSSGLVNALKFISVAQKDQGQLSETHCVLSNNYAIAFNGVIAAGHRIDEDLSACPQTNKLIAALERCGESLSITQLDGERLSIKSEKFKAVVPCAGTAQIQTTQPDYPCATINDKLKEGFSVVSQLVKDTGPSVVEASLLLQAGSMVSTNRHVMLEYWHGIDLPPNMAIPKASAIAVAKTTKPLVKLGFCERSVTFWFEDDSWIKTQQYAEPWPDVAKVLNVASNPWPIPPTFFHGLDAVSPFCDEGKLYFLKNKLCSHDVENVGASYEVDGIPEGPVFNPKYLKLCEPYMQKVDFIGRNGVAYFFGENVRGAICGIVNSGR